MNLRIKVASLNISTGQKIEFLRQKATSQRTQLSGVKLNCFYKLPTSQNSQDSVFCFTNSLIERFLCRCFYIQNSKMCLSNNLFYQNFLVFCLAWDSFSSENILYMSLHRTKNFKDIQFITF